MTVPGAWYLGLAALLFTIGAVGLLIRRNVLVMFMCVELMLNAVNLTFITFARVLDDVGGQSTVFFVLVGILVIGVIAASYRYLPKSGFLVHLALGLQLGGAVGNLIDRIRQGYVVDFVDFGYHSNWWPVFNVADSAIVVGVALLALNALSPTASGKSGTAADASG